MFFLFHTGPAGAQTPGKKVILPSDYQKHFEKYSVMGSIIVHDLKNDRAYYFDKDRTRERFSPASTFKIFNSLVGLETGVIPDMIYANQQKQLADKHLKLACFAAPRTFHRSVLQ